MSKWVQLRYTASEALSNMQHEKPTPRRPQDVTEIVRLFEMISRVPRPSGREQRVRDTVRNWAGGNGFATATDEAGNLLVRVPATARCGHAPALVLQAHLDMVCQKRTGSAHDFDTDPIVPLRDGEWLRAAETTLGADNGIGVALALAAALPSTGVPHPELELLFTVDEEEGLRGASGLEPSLLRGRILINLDSESDGAVTIGCAGGAGMVMTLPAPVAALEERNRSRRTRQRHGSPPHRDDPLLLVRLSVTGLLGGHSGTDIHRGRASANRLLGRLLSTLAAAPSFRLGTLEGGSAHNAIAREAKAEFAVSPSDYARCRQRVLQCAAAIRAEYRETDPGLRIAFLLLWGTVPGVMEELERVAAQRNASTYESALLQLRSHAGSVQAVRLLAALPHGVYRVAADGSGDPADGREPDPTGCVTVETSSNLAIVRSKDDSIEIVSSLRSLSARMLEELAAVHRSIAAGNGAKVQSEGAYGGWTSDSNSALVQRCVQVHRRLFSTVPALEVVHAGLECGAIAQAYPEMQMVSLGPTIVDAHTPDERLSLPSLERTWRLLAGILASYCSCDGSSDGHSDGNSSR